MSQSYNELSPTGNNEEISRVSQTVVDDKTQLEKIMFRFWFSVTIKIREIGSAPRLNLQSFTVPGSWRFQQVYDFLKQKCQIPEVGLDINPIIATRNQSGIKNQSSSSQTHNQTSPKHRTAKNFVSCVVILFFELTHANIRHFI